MHTVPVGLSRRLIADWLRRSVDFGLKIDDVDSDEIATIVFAMYIGLHVQWRVTPDAIDLDRSFAVMATLLRAALAT